MISWTIVVISLERAFIKSSEPVVISAFSRVYFFWSADLLISSLKRQSKVYEQCLQCYSFKSTDEAVKCHANI